MSKSIPEIFEFIGKNLLKTETQNLVLKFLEKDLEVRFEDLQKEEIVDMLLFHLTEKNYLAEENGESEQVEGQIQEDEIPEIKLTYQIQNQDLETLEMEDSELIKMFSKYWGYLMFMKKSELPKDINILKKRESKALTKMQLKRLKKKAPASPVPQQGQCTIKKSRTNKTVIKEFVPHSQ